MTAATAQGTEATRWSCDRCGVSVGRMDGERVILPDTWSRTEAGLHCLGCSRAQAEDAAIEAAPAGTVHADIARIRRVARVEFEISRTPDAPDQTIARACRTSASKVEAIRNAAT